jgi:CubicO group peptidase (beta-lactamase class C family)
MASGGIRLVSEQWIKQARTPGVANAEYGYANWYLNTGRKPMPAAPASSVRFSGDGPNIIYIDWENDLVVVVRWMRNDALNEFLGKVIGALRARPTA